MKCDELKATSSGEIRARNALLGYWWYEKSEADKVIAELKQKINEAQTELELWRDGSIISEAHQKELDGKRHSDYKRCLAMATFCHVSSVLCEGPDSLFYRRWFHKWYELAEKFKPNSTAQ